MSPESGPMLVGIGKVEGAAVSAVIGGTAAVLGGGKFANGAITAAFGYLFNAEGGPDKLGMGYTSRIDQFRGPGGLASFEIHVFNPAGEEIGVYGEKGWINKHGYTSPPNVPEPVENALRGTVIDRLRAMGVVPEKGTANIRGVPLPEIPARVGGGAGGGGGGSVRPKLPGQCFDINCVMPIK